MVMKTQSNTRFSFLARENCSETKSTKISKRTESQDRVGLEERQLGVPLVMQLLLQMKEWS